LTSLVALVSRVALVLRALEMDSESSELDSPVVPRVLEADAAKKKSRGVRLSKADREARKEQRLAAAQGKVGAASEDTSDDAFAARRAQLLQHVARAEWQDAGALGKESLQLAKELLRAMLPLGRHKLAAHLAAQMTMAVPASAPHRSGRARHRLRRVGRGPCTRRRAVRAL
jgi:hypothetical protein